MTSCELSITFPMVSCGNWAIGCQDFGPQHVQPARLMSWLLEKWLFWWLKRLKHLTAHGWTTCFFLERCGDFGDFDDWLPNLDGPNMSKLRMESKDGWSRLKTNSFICYSQRFQIYPHTFALMMFDASSPYLYAGWWNPLVSLYNNHSCW